MADVDIGGRGVGIWYDIILFHGVPPYCSLIKTGGRSFSCSVFCNILNTSFEIHNWTVLKFYFQEE